VKKTALVILAFLGAFCAAAASAQTTVPMASDGVLDLPAYPDSRLEAEMNVSDQDILPLFKDLFMSVLELGQEGMKSLARSPEAAKMMGPMGGLQGVFQDANIVDALKCLVEPVEQVKFQLHKLETAQAKEAAKDIGAFYAEEFAKRGWTRVFFINEDPGELVMAYALRDRGGLAFLVVDSNDSAAEIINFGMKGLPDLAKMFRTLGPVLGQMMEKMPIGMMMGTIAPPGAPPEVEEIEEMEEGGEE
jgi:hypothetical protein